VHSVFATTLRANRRALPGWVVAVVVLVGWIGSVFPSISGNDQFDQLLESYPEAFKKLFGLTAGLSMTSGVGYLQTELFSMILPICFLIFAIGAGSRAVAGEEDDRTIDLLLANPITRRRIVLEKFAAFLAMVTALSVAAFGALVAIDAAFSMDVAVSRLGIGVLVNAALAVHFAAFSLAAGAIFGHRSGAVAAGASFGVGAFLWNGLAALNESLDRFRFLSPWYHGPGTDPLRTGLSASHLGLLLATAVVWVLVAVVAFDHRDVAT
jgi:ABC-2 type transport system permease protein